MVLSPAGLRPERDCTDEALQQQQIRDSSSRQKGCYKITNSQLSKENFKKKEKLVTGLDDGLTPGQTGRLTVGRKITLTLTLTLTLEGKNSEPIIAVLVRVSSNLLDGPLPARK
jgi:hypothetical protein